MKLKNIISEQLATKPFGGWFGITIVFVASVLIVIFS